MKRFFSLFAIACIISLFVGCSSSTSKKSLGYKHYVGPDRVLVLLLPPMGGKGSHYETHGFVEAVREKGFEADLKILDVKPIYYFQGRIIELVKNELVDPAKASGYERLILVGTSLGGHGALLYINQYPEDVDGVVLLAPFLGWSRVADAVEKAGGLKKWEDCPALE
ncbi:MAG: alpha/beta fold hydrolase, partial [Syntrophobacterales bacterium]